MIHAFAYQPVSKNLQPSKDDWRFLCHIFILISFPLTYISAVRQSLLSSPFSCSFWISGKAESMGETDLFLILRST